MDNERALLRNISNIFFPFPGPQVDTLDIFRPESILDTARLAFGVSAFGKLLVEQVHKINQKL